ncbi:MAG: Acyl-CoA dehydrogenase [Pseudomonadales bacterium]|nr:Acyl-CoA dehydrogenase [Pseudomonadales bacterium]
MELEPTAEQRQIQDAARRFLHAECPPSLVRSLRERRAPLPRELWKRIAELGWLGLPFDERHGGAAADWTTIGLVMEELGRACDPTPFADCVLGCGWLIQDLGDGVQCRRWLVPLIAGELQAALAVFEAGGDWRAGNCVTTLTAQASGWRLDGRKFGVENAGSRELLLVSCRDAASGRLRLAAVSPQAPGVQCVALRSLAHPDLHELRLDGVEVTAEDLLGGEDIEAALDAALLRTAAFQAAAAAGGARRVLELATQHVQQRVQFGRPIGSFQAVQHLLANVWTDVEAAWLAAYEGITELERSPAAIDKACAAKCIANEAFTRACFSAHQVFGGMGYMWETDLHLWTRKAKELELGCGGLQRHRNLLAATLR